MSFSTKKNTKKNAIGKIIWEILLRERAKICGTNWNVGQQIKEFHFNMRACVAECVCAESYLGERSLPPSRCVCT